jgi:hypothetical protein
MSRRVQLREIAHARAGDKGDISNVSLFVFDPRHYETIKAQVTPDLLKARFGGLLQGEIRRYEIDHLQALNFVMSGALEGGVNSSLNLDSHGKSWSFLLLSLEINLDE